MSTNVFVFTVFMGLGTILLLAGLRYLGVSKRAAAQVAEEGAYRDLAARATQAQAETAAALAALRAGLAEANARLAAVETMLKEVG